MNAMTELLPSRCKITYSFLRFFKGLRLFKSVFFGREGSYNLNPNRQSPIPIWLTPRSANANRQSPIPTQSSGKITIKLVPFPGSLLAVMLPR